MRFWIKLASAWGITLLGSTVAVGYAQPPATAAAPSPSQPDYHPSMGDLMTMAVQPRHTKLGVAGTRRNWTYAAYELAELRNAFARVARTIPLYGSTDTAAIVDAMTRAQLAAVDSAIKNADSNAFSSAYAQLTAACNACHTSQAHAMVVIKAPTAASFPDQDFEPVRH